MKIRTDEKTPRLTVNGYVVESTRQQDYSHAAERLEEARVFADKLGAAIAQLSKGKKLAGVLYDVEQLAEEVVVPDDLNYINRLMDSLDAAHDCLTNEIRSCLIDPDESECKTELLSYGDCARRGYLPSDWRKKKYPQAQIDPLTEELQSLKDFRAEIAALASKQEQITYTIEQLSKAFNGLAPEQQRKFCEAILNLDKCISKLAVIVSSLQQYSATND